MGFLKEIHRCWITIDNKLYIWDYYNNNDIACFDGLENLIVSVGLVIPKKDIFRDDILYLLVVTTPVEIVILGLSFQDKNINKEMYLHNSPFCVTTNNVSMLSIDGNKTGRIFLGGNDGNIYELIYDNEENLSSLFGVSKRCELLNLTYSYFTLLPPFLSFYNKNDSISKVLVDKDRNLLYCLTVKSVITLYDLGENNNLFHYIGQCADINKDSFNLCKRKESIKSFPKKDTFNNNSKEKNNVLKYKIFSFLFLFYLYFLFYCNRF